jgi:hypothetical protein
MLLLCLLLLAIFMLSAAVSYWLEGTALADATLRYIYSTVAAIIFISVLFDISVVASLPAWSFILVSILIAIGLFYYQWSRNGPPAIHFASIFRYRAGIYSVIILGLLCYLSYMFIPHSGRWGRWDARAIWTLHALFLTYPNDWTNLFSGAIAWSHSDYPLLLPSLVAMCWKAMGAADAIVPCVIAYMVFITVLFTVCAGLKQKDRSFLGILGLLPFVFTNGYIKMAASQGADTLLSLFILMALVLARQNEKSRNTKLIFLTGFIAGFAGWIKNEGVPFTIVFSLAIFWQYRKTPYRIAYYFAGITLPLLIIVLFKIIYAPANDIMAGQSHSALSRLMDLSRYKMTGKYFADNILHLYPAILVIAGLVIISNISKITSPNTSMPRITPKPPEGGLNSRPACIKAPFRGFGGKRGILGEVILKVSLRGYRRLWDWQLFIIILMMGVYFFIFILTPRDLQWHLANASDRLLLQLFPAFVYILLSILAGKIDLRHKT